MIITFSNWCTNIGKSTLSLFYSQYLIKNSKASKVFIIDATDNLYLYNLFSIEKKNIDIQIAVDFINNEKIKVLNNEFVLSEMSESNDIYIVDLKANFGSDFLNLLKYSNHIVLPFARYDDILTSTSKYANFLNENVIDNGNIFFIENYFNKHNHINSMDYFNDLGIVIRENISINENFKMTFSAISNDMFIFKKVFDELTHSIFD